MSGTHVRAASPWINLSFYPPLSLYQDADITGVDIGLIATHTGGVRGLHTGLAVAIAERAVYGVQGAFIHCSADACTGYQTSFLCKTGGFMVGVQDGFICTAGGLTGVQTGFLCVTESLHGLQIGFINIGGDVAGVQIGFLNSCDRLHGMQLGLLNIAGEGAMLPFMVFLNAGF
jgi:hypothetical protein